MTINQIYFFIEKSVVKNKNLSERVDRVTCRLLIKVDFNLGNYEILVKDYIVLSVGSGYPESEPLWCQETVFFPLGTGIENGFIFLHTGNRRPETVDRNRVARIAHSEP